MVESRPHSEPALLDVRVTVSQALVILAVRCGLRIAEQGR
jgi:hypothetical protein